MIKSDIQKQCAAIWLIIMSAGCTAVSLERHTVNQALTSADLRYQLVLNNLARMAANPGNLPAFGTVTDGLANVTDSYSFDGKTALDGLKGFTGETLTEGATRQPDLSWTMDPAHTAAQLQAMQAAFQWVMPGSVSMDDGTVQLLKDFQVYDDLLCLPPGWFAIGSKAQVPKHACYVGHYCTTYVWVVPGGMKAFSDFTLILTDIATVDPGSLLPVATIDFSKLNGTLDDSVTHPKPPIPADCADCPKPTPSCLKCRSNDAESTKISALTPAVSPDGKAMTPELPAPSPSGGGDTTTTAPESIAGPEAINQGPPCDADSTGQEHRFSMYSNLKVTMPVRFDNCKHDLSFTQDIVLYGGVLKMCHTWAPNMENPNSPLVQPCPYSNIHAARGAVPVTPPTSSPFRTYQSSSPNPEYDYHQQQLLQSR